MPQGTGEDVSSWKYAHPFFAVAFLCPSFPWPQSHGFMTEPFVHLARNEETDGGGGGEEGAGEEDEEDEEDGEDDEATAVQSSAEEEAEEAEGAEGAEGAEAEEATEEDEEDEEDEEGTNEAEEAEEAAGDGAEKAEEEKAEAEKGFLRFRFFAACARKRSLVLPFPSASASSSLPSCPLSSRSSHWTSLSGTTGSAPPPSLQSSSSLALLSVDLLSVALSSLAPLYTRSFSL